MTYKPSLNLSSLMLGLLQDFKSDIISESKWKEYLSKSYLNIETLFRDLCGCNDGEYRLYLIGKLMEDGSVKPTSLIAELVYKFTMENMAIMKQRVLLRLFFITAFFLQNDGNRQTLLIKTTLEMYQNLSTLQLQEVLKNKRLFNWIWRLKRFKNPHYLLPSITLFDNYVNRNQECISRFQDHIFLFILKYWENGTTTAISSHLKVILGTSQGILSLCSCIINVAKGPKHNDTAKKLLLRLLHIFGVSTSYSTIGCPKKVYFQTIEFVLNEGWHIYENTNLNDYSVQKALLSATTELTSNCKEAIPTESLSALRKWISNMMKRIQSNNKIKSKAIKLLGSLILPGQNLAISVPFEKPLVSQLSNFLNEEAEKGINPVDDHEVAVSLLYYCSHYRIKLGRNPLLWNMIAEPLRRYMSPKCLIWHLNWGSLEMREEIMKLYPEIFTPGTHFPEVLRLIKACTQNAVIMMGISPRIAVSTVTSLASSCDESEKKYLFFPSSWDIFVMTVGIQRYASSPSQNFSSFIKYLNLLMDFQALQCSHLDKVSIERLVEVWI